MLGFLAKAVNYWRWKVFFVAIMVYTVSHIDALESPAPIPAIDDTIKCDMTRLKSGHVVSLIADANSDVVLFICPNDRYQSKRAFSTILTISLPFRLMKSLAIITSIENYGLISKWNNNFMLPFIFFKSEFQLNEETIFLIGWIVTYSSTLRSWTGLINSNGIWLERCSNSLNRHALLKYFARNATPHLTQHHNAS